MPRAPFLNLSADKQAAIVSAATAEFAEHGYRGASTNRIVAEVGISKGSLFYYFDGKDDLYLHVYEQWAKAFAAELERHRDKWSRDLLQRLRIMTESGLDILVRDPGAFRLQASFLEPEVTHLRERYTAEHARDAVDEFHDWFGDIDRSMLRYDWATTMRLVMWTYLGMKTELIYMRPLPGDPSDFKKTFMERLDLVINVLRQALYVE